MKKDSKSNYDNTYSELRVKIRKGSEVAKIYFYQEKRGHGKAFLEKLIKDIKKWSYKGTSFSYMSEDSNPRGIAWDGTYFWIMGITNGRAYEQTAAGSYTGTSFSISDVGADPSAITWDGTYFWITGITNVAAYQYTAAGIYTGISISLSEDSFPQGITEADEYLWVVGSEYDTTYKYNRTLYTRPSVLVYVDLKYGNGAFENGKTKRWYQDIYLDVEWSTE